MAYRERQKISQMTPKGANLGATDLIEVSTIESGSYVTRSITGKDLIDAAGGGGGNSSVNYYLNGSVSASVATYNQMSKTAIIGTGTDFNLTGNGLIAQFLTDAGDPNRLLIPSGAWNFEMFFNISSSGGNAKFYVELLKYDGSIFTSIASSSAIPEQITGGTNIDLYLTSIAVPTTILLVTDRLAVRVYIVDNSGGRTVTLHTEDNTLCEIITTFSSGVTSLNGLTANTQYLATGTSGTDFAINSVTDTHTFNLPTASATNRGALSSTDWTTFDNKAPKEITTSKQSSSYILVLSDNYKLIEMEVSTANTLTIPTNTSEPFPIGTQILISQLGTGQTTITPALGVTIRSSGGKTKTAAQYAMLTLIKRTTNEWYLAGDLTT